MSILEQAEIFLKNFLAAGPRTASETLEGARQERIGSRTLKEAKRRLNVRSNPVREEGKRGVKAWLWQLPDALETPIDLLSRSTSELSPTLAPLPETISAPLISPMPAFLKTTVTDSVYESRTDAGRSPVEVIPALPAELRAFLKNLSTGKLGRVAPELQSHVGLLCMGYIAGNQKKALERLQEVYRAWQQHSRR